MATKTYYDTSYSATTSNDSDLLVVQQGSPLASDLSQMKKTTVGTIRQPLVNAINAKYTKPVSGIPESDLSAEVQTKLNTSSVTDVQVNNVSVLDGTVAKIDLTGKVDKISGKGLSTEDYTTAEKTKLASAITEHQDISGKQDKITSSNKLSASLVSGLATVATSGSYTDLSNKPTIPSEVTESTVSGWGFTKNTGTITGITMNGSSKGTSGVVDLGTVITSHQDISGKADKATTLEGYGITDAKISSGVITLGSNTITPITSHQDISGKVDKTTTVNGHALSSNVTVSASDIGLGNVGNFKAVSTVASQGLTDAEKANAIANIGAGTITGITMNGSSKGTSGVVDLGTVITTHQDISGKTNTSVLPNDSYNKKTKFRIANQGNTGGGSTYWYYPLCKLPTDNAGNCASAIIKGRVGGWEAGNMASIEALAWNRGSTGIAHLSIAGSASSMSAIYSKCDIAIYTNDDTTDTVYLKCASYFTFDVDIEMFGDNISILYDGTYTTSPAGTLNALASTSSRRIEVVNGTELINGSAAEIATNKVTSISSSSTDTQYPSAKCVNSAISNISSQKADKPVTGSLSLPTASWTGSASPYSQTITISGSTSNSKIDIEMDNTAISQMLSDGTNAIYVVNNNGTLTAYAVGTKPSVDLTVQFTRTEVA